MKRKHWYVPLLLIAVFLSGCASIGKKAGFEVTAKEPIGRQEPWHTMTLKGDISQVQALSVAYVALPDPVPTYWSEEFVDTHRVYEVSLSNDQNGKQKKALKPLEKVVFRALRYTDGGEFIEMFDAVLNPSLSGFFVLLPSEGNFVGSNLVIIPLDASWLMTVYGERVILPVSKTLPAGFFQQHPSRITQVVRMDKKDPHGQKFFSELEKLFDPGRFIINGVVYSGRPDTKIVASRFTKVDNPIDRLVSCGTAPISPGMITVSLAIAAVHNVRAMTKEDCMK